MIHHRLDYHVKKLKSSSFKIFYFFYMVLNPPTFFAVFLNPETPVLCNKNCFNKTALEPDNNLQIYS